MNKFAEYVIQEMGDMSIRELSRRIDFSHSAIALMLRGKRQVTWDFAAKAAPEFGLGYLDAFRMAGLLPKENSAQGNPTLDAVSVEKVPHSVPQNPANVTNGAENA